MDGISALLADKLAHAAAAETEGGPHPLRAETLLERAGIVPGGDLDARVSANAYYELWTAVLLAVPDPIGFPLRCAVHLVPDDYGALGLAFKTAANLNEAGVLATRYLKLLTDAAWLDTRVAEGEVHFVLLRPGAHHPGTAPANEAALAEILNTMRNVAGREVRPTRVLFAHESPGDTRVHQNFFGCPVIFAAGQNALCFLPETLAAPLPKADVGLSRFLVQHLQGLLGDDNDPASLRRIRRTIGDALPAGPPRIEVVARRMGSSTRTLQRRLAEANMTFQGLVDETRRGLAEQLLRTGRHAPGEVAFLTGFSEPSAFSRAFKRWTGQSPAQWARKTGSG